MTNNEKSNAIGEWEVCGTGNGHSIHARCKSQACLRRENVIFRSNHDANTFSSCSLKASFLRPVFVDLHLLLLATGFSSTQSAFSLMSGICETWLFLPCGWSCWRRWSCTWHWPRMRLRQSPWLQRLNWNGMPEAGWPMLEAVRLVVAGTPLLYVARGKEGVECLLDALRT